MMLAIAIIAGIAYIFSVIDNYFKERVDVNLLIAAILVLATWSVLPVAITVICITLIIGVIGVHVND